MDITHISTDDLLFLYLMPLCGHGKAASVAGITGRRLLTWHRRHVLDRLEKGHPGTGCRRRYSLAELLYLRHLAELCRHGLRTSVAARLAGIWLADDNYVDLVSQTGKESHWRSVPARDRIAGPVTTALAYATYQNLHDVPFTTSFLERRRWQKDWTTVTSLSTLPLSHLWYEPWTCAVVSDMGRIARDVVYAARDEIVRLVKDLRDSDSMEAQQSCERESSNCG